MLDELKVWWVILTQVGPVGKSSRSAEGWIRFFVVDALREEGLFEYLQEARNCGQIIAHFGFVDSPYTREVLETLSSERHNLLLKEGDRYRRNPGALLPTREEVEKRTTARFHGMTMWQDCAQRIPERMRQEPIDFVRRMEQEGRAVFRFDQTLSLDLYAALRKAAFAYVNVRELRGKRLLDVACGSGYETADIWLWLKGDVQIAALDAVPGLLNLAEQHFEEIVGQSKQRDVAPLTETNCPSFHLMSATDLDFPDESFDVVFHSTALHWTSDPARAIEEVGRVLKPGGLVFGTQVTKPLSSPYLGLIIQVHENAYGHFWEEEFRRWYERAGVSLSITSPAGVFRGRKIGH